MISRNKGIFSLEFLVPVFGFLFAVGAVELWYRTTVTPAAEEFMAKRRIIAARGAVGDSSEMRGAHALLDHQGHGAQI